MVLLKTPKAAIGSKAPDFNLPGVDGKNYSLKDCMGKNGLVVMFICNHCPYVKSIIDQLLLDVDALHKLGIGVIGICSNDPEDYVEDNFEHMKILANEKNFNFPYCQDITQAVAKAYGAVCTPDFFGYNAQYTLQYRGRLNEAGRERPTAETKHELLEAMKLIAETGNGPEIQIPSMGCSIKWRENS